MAVTYVFRTGIVTTAVAANMREMSRRLDKGDCGGMFVVGLVPIGSPAGTAPTRWISSGWVPQVYSQTIADPTLCYTRAKKAWEDDGDVFPYTQAQVTNALANCEFTNGTYQGQPESPQQMMARLGLEPARPAI